MPVLEPFYILLGPNCHVISDIKIQEKNAPPLIKVIHILFPNYQTMV